MFYMGGICFFCVFCVFCVFVFFVILTLEVYKETGQKNRDRTQIDLK